LRIYKKTNSPSIVTYDFKTNKVSTRSSYYDSFFKDLESGHYNFFDQSMVGVKSVDHDSIVFSESEAEFPSYKLSPEETYIYIGDANTTEELLFIIENPATIVLTSHKTKNISIFSKILSIFS